MAMFSRSRHRQASRRFVSRAAAQGLISAHDQLLGHASGNLIEFQSGTVVRRFRLNPTDLGFTDKQLVVITTDHAMAADLVMLKNASWTNAGRRRYAMLACLHDRDAGMTALTMDPVDGLDDGFITQLNAAAQQRRTAFSNVVLSQIDAWSEELVRRNLESVRVVDNVPEPPAGASPLMLPIRFQALAFEPKHANAGPLFEVEGDLVCFSRGRVLVLLEEKVPVAYLDTHDVTYLSVPGPMAFPEAGGTWELGYQSPSGERRLIFTGPGTALTEGGVDQSADRFLTESGLRDHSCAVGDDAGWLSSTAVEPQYRVR